MKGLSKLIMQLEALGVFEELRKIRAVAGGVAASVASAVGAHSDLTGVTADQHHSENHETRHRLGGADELSHDNLAGASANDHHNQAHDSGDHTTAGTAEIADVAAAEGAGTSDKVPRGDHVHAHGSGYLPNAHHNQAHAIDGADHSGSLAHTALSGVSADQHHAQAHSDSDHSAGFGTPSGDVDVGDSAGAGVATTHSRSDHQHAFPAPSTGYPVDVAAAEGDGAATTPARSDHLHAHGAGYLPNAHHNQSHSDSDHTAGFGTPSGDIDIGDSAAAGAASTHSRSDHQHAFPAPTTGYPIDVAATEGDGTGITSARADHKHAHGSGYLPDAHHNKSHVHDGADGSGSVDHGSLSGLSDDDHPQYATNTEFDDHSTRHASGGADELSHDGLAGVSANDHHAQAHDLTSSDHTDSSLDDGQVLKATGATSFAWEDDVAVIAFIIDGGGSVITAGMKGGLEVPFACTITRATLLEISDTPITSSIVIDIWKDTYANYPPVVGDSITASAKPTLTSGVKSQDATLTGWTVTVAAGDILFFNVEATPTAAKKVLISLKVKKT